MNTLSVLSCAALLCTTPYAFAQTLQSVSDSAQQSVTTVQSSALPAEKTDTNAILSDTVMKITATHQNGGCMHEKTSFRVNRDGTCIIKETKDTVYTIKQPDPETVSKSFRQRLNDLRVRGFGGGGGPVWDVYAINIAPVVTLLKADKALSSRDFGFNNFNEEPFIMKGGMGFGGLGNGLRLGGIGLSGERKIVSDHFSGDSAILLTVKVNTGGFLIEKAMVHDRMNYVAGGYIGGGSMQASVQTISGKISSFTRDSDTPSKENPQPSTASFASLELHGAVTYTLYAFMHVGLGLSMPVFISTNGFETYPSQFVTVNPGLQLKVIFGNLG